MEHPLPPFAIALIVIAPLVAIPLFASLVALLLSFVSGWQRMSRRYATTQVPHGDRLSWQSAGVGVVAYRNCLTLHVAQDGLFLAVPWFMRAGHRPLFIPWPELHSREPVKVLWLEAMRVQVGHPPLARLRLPMRVFRGMPGA